MADRGDVDCPYCGGPQKIPKDAPHEPFKKHQLACTLCAAQFVYHTFDPIPRRYKAAKADCLNGAPHNIQAEASENVLTNFCDVCDYTKHWRCTGGGSAECVGTDCPVHSERNKEFNDG